MPDNWTIYRLLCCTPPDLDAERVAFDAANASFAEQVTMQAWILFGLASMRPDCDARVHRHALESNIRFCDFSVHIFGEADADPAFTGFLELSIACSRDAAFPMRSTAVMFRNPENASQELSSLRAQLLATGACVIRDFHDLDEFNVSAREILSNWYSLVPQTGNLCQ